MTSRKIDYSNSSQVKSASARKATSMPKPESSLKGVTLWGTQVGATEGTSPADTHQRRPTSRSNHFQNEESPYRPEKVRVGGAHNHYQNVETSQVDPRPKLRESRINDSHLTTKCKQLTEERPRSKMTSSRINEGSIVFGASDTPKAPPPAREPFQETPRRGHVRQVLPGWTDAYKFGE